MKLRRAEFPRANARTKELAHHLALMAVATEGASFAAKALWACDPGATLCSESPRPSESCDLPRAAVSTGRLRVVLVENRSATSWSPSVHELLVVRVKRSVRVALLFPRKRARPTRAPDQPKALSEALHPLV